MDSVDIRRLCGYEHHLRAPFSVRLWGSVWAVASNGQGLVMLRGVDRFEPHPYIDGERMNAITFAGLGAFSYRAEYADLATLFRRQVGLRCAKCLGSGDDINGEDACVVCDGTGEVKSGENSWGRIGPAMFNAELIWRYLGAVYSPIVKIAPPAGEFHPLGIAADDDSWRIMVMPARGVEDVIEWDIPLGFLEAA
jgi:hypothetical protein